MANTVSWKFPDMFNIAQNRVNLITDEASVANRVKLLLLSDPTSLYNEPDFGVGLKRYLWQYNNENTRALIKDKIRDQLNYNHDKQYDQNEPCVIADDVTFDDDIVSVVENDTEDIAGNTLKMTVTMPVTFGGTVNMPLDDELPRWYDSDVKTNTDTIALRSE